MNRQIGGRTHVQARDRCHKVEIAQDRGNSGLVRPCALFEGHPTKCDFYGMRARPPRQGDIDVGTGQPIYFAP